MEVFSVVVQALTALAIVFAAWQLLFHSRQMHRDFELIYVQRYWELMDRRSPGFVTEGRGRRTDRPLITAYLQLCEDEIDLRRLGRVTDNTWGFWARSIVDQASTSPYASELGRVRPELYPLLRRLIESDAGFDPLDRSRLWRKLHGL
ncbi:hypothetical protein [Agromyces larvae]|uniref:DUF4760 domain-containing protein n=1 Tax=Agromyces larvae TaxID=2929802 RepID=A0ABY4BUL6_9MICO|nr:hypothetical protein [Agromyces larvae]UOE42890.1 hypothetical protein MTO99_11900 [Agromyces larvae]